MAGWRLRLTRVEDEKQIPFGDDNLKDKDNRKGKKRNAGVPPLRCASVGMTRLFVGGTGNSNYRSQKATTDRNCKVLRIQ
jgi:hypothetical protein